MQKLFHSYNKKLSGLDAIGSFRTLAGLLVLLWLLGQPAVLGREKDEIVWHLHQLHRSLGTVDIYITPRLMRLEKSGGDIIVLYRQDSQQVSIFNPGHKVIYTCPADRFFRQGFSITSSGLKACRSAKTVKRKQVKFLGQMADVLDVYAVGCTRTGKKVEVGCAGMKVLASKESFNKPVSVIETIYATPTTGALPLEMKLDYSPGGGEMWFQTSDRDLKNVPANKIDQTYFRLNTKVLAREKKTADFFALPLGYKKMDSDSAVINETDTASDLTKLVLP